MSWCPWLVACVSAGVTPLDHADLDVDLDLDLDVELDVTGTSLTAS